MHKVVSKNTIRKIAGLCTKAARILMASGAETSRVEETVSRIGKACKVIVESYATPTGITVTVGEEKSITLVTRVKNRTIDLSKVIAVNSVSRALSAGIISHQTAEREIDKIQAKPPLYSDLIIYLSQAFCCAGFALIISGRHEAIIPALLVGLLAKKVEISCAKLPPFLLVFINALAVTIFADICYMVYPVLDQSIVIIAGIIPLLPGLSLTNALADLMAGELIAGIARTTDSVLTAAALAAGAATGISLGQLLI